MLRWSVFSMSLMVLGTTLLLIWIGTWRIKQISGLGNLRVYAKNSLVSDLLREWTGNKTIEQFGEAWANEYELFIIDIWDSPDWKALNPWICQRIDSIIIDEHLEDISGDIPDLPNVRSVKLIENQNPKMLSELVRPANSIQYLEFSLWSRFGSKKSLQEVAEIFPEYDKIFVYTIDSGQLTLRETTHDSIQLMDLERDFVDAITIAFCKNRKYLESRLFEHWRAVELESITLIGADGNAYRLTDQEAEVLSKNCINTERLDVDISALSPKGRDALQRLTALSHLNGKPVKL